MNFAIPIPRRRITLQIIQYHISLEYFISFSKNIVLTLRKLLIPLTHSSLPFHLHTFEFQTSFSLYNVSNAQKDDIQNLSDRMESH